MTEIAVRQSADFARIVWPAEEELVRSEPERVAGRR